MFNPGDKVIHIPTGKIYTVDERYLGSSTAHIFVKEIDGGWFWWNSLKKIDPRPCGAMPGDCSGICDGCGNNTEATK